jgi:hypothetical protein
VTGRLDDQQQRYAAQLEHDHPSWVIIWGYHSRLYWAFPLFNAPQGTVVAAPSPAELTEAMRRAELAAAVPPGPRPAAPRPRQPQPPSRPPRLAGATDGQAAEMASGPAGGGQHEPQARVG